MDTFTLSILNVNAAKALVTRNYNFDGNVIKTSTVFSYTADQLTQSVTYRDTVTLAQAQASQEPQTILDVDGVTEIPNPAYAAITNTVRSVTDYIGNENEEK